MKIFDSHYFEASTLSSKLIYRYYHDSEPKEAVIMKSISNSSQYLSFPEEIYIEELPEKRIKQLGIIFNYHFILLDEVMNKFIYEENK